MFTRQCFVNPHISYDVCPWFSCWTALDRCQSMCVHSLPCHGVTFRFWWPSGDVHVTVFCLPIYIISCVSVVFMLDGFRSLPSLSVDSNPVRSISDTVVSFPHNSIGVLTDSISISDGVMTNSVPNSMNSKDSKGGVLLKRSCSGSSLCLVLNTVWLFLLVDIVLSLCLAVCLLCGWALQWCFFCIGSCCCSTVRSLCCPFCVS